MFRWIFRSTGDFVLFVIQTLIYGGLLQLATEYKSNQADEERRKKGIQFQKSLSLLRLNKTF